MGRGGPLTGWGGGGAGGSALECDKGSAGHTGARGRTETPLAAWLVSLEAGGGSAHLPGLGAGWGSPGPRGQLRKLSSPSAQRRLR